MIKRPRHILKMSLKETNNFLDSFDLVLTDCDGVLWIHKFPLPNVAEAFSSLEKANKKIGFVSNNGVRPRESYEKLFKNLNVKFDFTKQVLNPPDAIISYLKSIEFNGKIFLMAKSTIRDKLLKNNFNFVELPELTDLKSKKALKDMVLALKPINAVIFDADCNFNIAKIFCCEEYLKDPECLVLFGSIDSSMKVENQDFSGVMPAMLNVMLKTANRTAMVFSKPSIDLEPMILEKFKITDKKRVLFIGDNLEFDVQLANKIGFQSMVVLTGNTTEEMVQNIEKPECCPDFYANGFGDFMQLNPKPSE